MTALAALAHNLYDWGSLTIETIPPGVEIEVVPDRQADLELEDPGAGVDLPWRPKVPEKRRFRSGEKIRLRTGHYRVRFRRSLESNAPLA